MEDATSEDPLFLFYFNSVFFIRNDYKHCYVHIGNFTMITGIQTQFYKWFMQILDF